MVCKDVHLFDLISFDVHKVGEDLTYKLTDNHPVSTSSLIFRDNEIIHCLTSVFYLSMESHDFKGSFAIINIFTSVQTLH